MTLIDKRIIIATIAVVVLTTSAGLCAEQPKELTAFVAASLTGALGEI